MKKLFKRKNPIHKLKVGLRAQLCKECKDVQTRLCEVDGKPGIFHRWVDEDQALLKINRFCTLEESTLLAKQFQQDGIALPSCSTEVIRKTYALVEYTDGSVGKVKPELVTFLDRRRANNEQVY